MAAVMLGKWKVDQAETATQEFYQCGAAITANAQPMHCKKAGQPAQADEHSATANARTRGTWKAGEASAMPVVSAAVVPAMLLLPCCSAKC